MALDSVQHLGVEYGHRLLSRVLEESEEARALYDELLNAGLEPQPERTHLFNVFSAESLRSLLITITPFVTKDLRQEAGLSVSVGGHAQAVVVDVDDRTRITEFTHLAVSDDGVVASRHSVEELRGMGEKAGGGARPGGPAGDDQVRAVAEQAGMVRARRPLVEIDARQVRSLASVSYSSLLADSFSQSVHDEREITALRESTNVVAEIGLFALFRTSGSSCCSCSCSCWGSSSCSSSYTG